MDLLIAIAVLVVLLLVFVIVRRKRPAHDKRPGSAKSANAASTTAFHAVSIRFASSACSAAKSLQGKRFLSNAAPRLPLPDCDVPQCKCRFVHHKDRRAGDDRRDPYGAGIVGGTGSYRQEQRRGTDRRKDSDPF